MTNTHTHTHTHTHVTTGNEKKQKRLNASSLKNPVQSDSEELQMATEIKACSVFSPAGSLKRRQMAETQTAWIQTHWSYVSDP